MTTAKETFDEFPIAAQNFLIAFYQGRHILADSALKKVEALKESFLSVDTIIPCCDKNDPDGTLRAYEFAILTKTNMI